jgi:excisionase family DNA binding protein
MPLDHSPRRVCVSVREWCQSTGISKATTYRMMADGRLRYVTIGRSRKIPITEYTRLGLPLPEVT